MQPLKTVTVWWQCEIFALLLRSGRACDSQCRDTCRLGVRLRVDARQVGTAPRAERIYPHAKRRPRINRGDAAVAVCLRLLYIWHWRGIYFWRDVNAAHRRCAPCWFNYFINIRRHARAAAAATRATAVTSLLPAADSKRKSITPQSDLPLRPAGPPQASTNAKVGAAFCWCAHKTCWLISLSLKYSSRPPCDKWTGGVNQQLYITPSRVHWAKKQLSNNAAIRIFYW